MAKNDKCPISDSVLCKWLGKDCGDCYIRSMKDDDDALQMLQNFEVTLSLLPDDFDELQSEECQFCIGKKNEQAGYAIIDLGHNEPEHKKGMFFGIGKKVRQRIGSLMPVSISICKECRRTLRMVEIIKWLSVVVFFAIATLLVALPGTGQAIQNASEIMPYGIIIVGVLLGYILGRVASDAYKKAKMKTTRFHVFDIPVCDNMRRNGWFTIENNEGDSRFIFSSKSHTKRMAHIKDEQSGSE